MLLSFFNFVGFENICNMAILLRKKPTTTSFILVGYRLCGLASGALITVIFICSTLIIVSCLHFGQKRGKFLSSVSSRILSRVLLPHIGHKSHLSALTAHLLAKYKCISLIKPFVRTIHCFLKLFKKDFQVVSICCCMMYGDRKGDSDFSITFHKSARFKTWNKIILNSMIVQ